MENLTPGRKLILDLLAKSVAKIQAADTGNKLKLEDGKSDGRKGKMKRDSMKVPGKLRKKIKTEKKSKENVDATKEELKIIQKIDADKTELSINMVKTKESVKKENKVSVRKENGFNKADKELKTEELQINGKKWKRKNKKNKVNVDTTSSVKIKGEYTKIKTEQKDLEIYVKPEIKNNKLASCNISSRVKNENNKDIIKVDDNLVVKHMEKSDIFELTTKVKDVKKMKHVKKSLKKEYLRLELDSTLENKDLISKDKSNVRADGHKRESNKKYYTKRKSGFSSKRFSPEEDQIILDAIETFGDKIDIAQIAEDLQRTVTSIGHEVRKLKAGKVKKKLVRMYTLSEDLVILEAVLEHLGEDSLKVVNLTQSGWREIGGQIGKEAANLRQRWDRTIRPWILQHFAGTRNLDLTRPLANYLVDNFPDVNSIDWFSVASRPEFAGHTQLSLRRYFSSHLFRSELHKDVEDITLEMIAKFANTKYAVGGRKIPNSVLKRQQEIIDYFECYVKTNGIEISSD